MIPEEAAKYLKDNPDRLVRTKEMGSFCFWYIQPSGHYKTVCRTRFNHRTKRIKNVWFRLKVFIYKATHNTNYRPPNRFDSITIKL